MTNEYTIFYNVPKSRVERMQQSTAHFDLNTQINDYLRSFEAKKNEVKRYREWTTVYSKKGTPCLSDVFGFGGYENFNIEG